MLPIYLIAAGYVEVNLFRFTKAFLVYQWTEHVHATNQSFPWMSRAERRGLSAAQVMLSVSGRQLCFTAISKPKHGTARAKLQQCLQVHYHCCHEKQTPDCLFITYLPSSLHVCQEIAQTNTRTGFLLCHFKWFEPLLRLHLLFIDTSSSRFECFKHLMKDYIFYHIDKCEPATPLGPNRGSCPAHLSLLSPHLQ